MLFFLQCWGIGFQNRRNAVSSDADDLILLYDVHAYEEARRRRFEAKDVSAARHWGAVKSEIGQRIVAVCGDEVVSDALKSRLADADEFGCAFPGQAADGRAEANRPAVRIGDAKNDAQDRGRSSIRTAGVPPEHARLGGVRRRVSLKASRVPALDVLCDA